jgi:hypothetical protein
LILVPLLDLKSLKETLRLVVQGLQIGGTGLSFSAWVFPQEDKEHNERD